jgi:Na+/melibiose symporter-like transporter
MRISYGTILEWLLIAWGYFCIIYFLLGLIFKLPPIVFLVVTIAVLSAMMYLFYKYTEETFSRIEKDIEELMRHSNDNLER